MSYLFFGAIEFMCPKDSHFEHEGTCIKYGGPGDCPPGFFWNQGEFTCKPTSGNQCTKGVLNPITWSCEKDCPALLPIEIDNECRCPNKKRPHVDGTCPSSTTQPPPTNQEPNRPSTAQASAPSSGKVALGAGVMGAVAVALILIHRGL